MPEIDSEADCWTSVAVAGVGVGKLAYSMQETPVPTVVVAVVIVVAAGCAFVAETEEKSPEAVVSLEAVST